MKLFCFIVLFAVAAVNESLAQLSQQDTILYLLSEQNNFHESDSSRAVNMKTMEWYPIKRYALRGDYYLYDGYPLEFESEHIALIDTVSLAQIQKYPLVTPKQLKAFIAKHYEKTKEKNPSYYARSYFDQLKHIYIVEKDSTTKTATITEVKLDVQIE